MPGVLHESSSSSDITDEALGAVGAGASSEAVSSAKKPMKRTLSGRSLTDDHTSAEKAAMVADAMHGVPEALGDDEKAPWLPEGDMSSRLPATGPTNTTHIAAGQS